MHAHTHTPTERCACVCVCFFHVHWHTHTCGHIFSNMFSFWYANWPIQSPLAGLQPQNECKFMCFDRNGACSNMDGWLLNKQPASCPRWVHEDQVRWSAGKGKLPFTLLIHPLFLRDSCLKNTCFARWVSTFATDLACFHWRSFHFWGVTRAYQFSGFVPQLCSK